MSKFDLDSFGEIIDQFLKENEVKMLLTLPEGTLDVQVMDNTGLVLHPAERNRADLRRNAKEHGD